MSTRYSNRRITFGDEDDVTPISRGHIFPRVDLARLEHHLPRPQRVRIDINGRLCGAPWAIPDAVKEFALGWAFAHRFFERYDQVSRISVTGDKVSIMAVAGSDLDRLRDEAAGLVARDDLSGEAMLSVVEPSVRSTAVMSELDCIAVLEQAFDQFDRDGAKAGYTHAGLATNDEVVCVARDLSADAAVQKILGWILSAGYPAADTVLVIHGIVDVHQVEAAALIGIPIVGADAVPTMPAITAARTRGVTLIGLARSTRRAAFVDGGHFSGVQSSEWDDLFGATPTE